MATIQTLTVNTQQREELVNITSRVGELVATSGVRDGAVEIFCPHTTGAITIQEAADPDVARDLQAILRRLVPHRGDYHHAEGNSDAHTKSALTGCAERVFVADSRLVLGTWQGIFFCEFDGPRQRKVWVKVVADPT